MADAIDIETMEVDQNLVPDISEVIADKTIKTTLDAQELADYTRMISSHYERVRGLIGLENTPEVNDRITTHGYAYFLQNFSEQAGYGKKFDDEALASNENMCDGSKLVPYVPRKHVYIGNNDALMYPTKTKPLPDAPVKGADSFASGGEGWFFAEGGRLLRAIMKLCPRCTNSHLQMLLIRGKENKETKAGCHQVFEFLWASERPISQQILEHMEKVTEWTEANKRVQTATLANVIAAEADLALSLKPKPPAPETLTGDAVQAALAAFGLSAGCKAALTVARTLGGTTGYRLKVTFPDPATVMTDFAINIERYKSAARLQIVKILHATNNMGACAPTAGASGYHRFALYASAIARKASRGLAWGDAKEYPGFEEEIMGAFITSFSTPFKVNMLRDSRDPFHAEVTIKEIYPEDVRMVPSLLYYAGIAAAMTDLYNKKVALKKPQALQPNFTQSKFYNDFKKAVTNRHCELADGDMAQILRIFCNPIMMCVRADSSVSVAEQTAIDGMLTALNTPPPPPRGPGGGGAGATGATPKTEEKGKKEEEPGTSSTLTEQEQLDAALEKRNRAEQDYLRLTTEMEEKQEELLEKERLEKERVRAAQEADVENRYYVPTEVAREAHERRAVIAEMRTKKPRRRTRMDGVPETPAQQENRLWMTFYGDQVDLAKHLKHYYPQDMDGLSDDGTDEAVFGTMGAPEYVVGTPPVRGSASAGDIPKVGLPKWNA